MITPVTLKIWPNLNLGKLPIIQPCAPQAGVVKLKTQGFDQMQSGTRVGTEPNNTASIRRVMSIVMRFLQPSLL